jgi:hypothetical protein
MRRFALLAVTASLTTLAAVPVVSSAAAPSPQTTPKPTPAPSPKPGGGGGHVKPFSGVSGADLAPTPTPTPTPVLKHPH